MAFSSPVRNCFSCDCNFCIRPCRHSRKVRHYSASFVIPLGSGNPPHITGRYNSGSVRVYRTRKRFDLFRDAIAWTLKDQLFLFRLSCQSLCHSCVRRHSRGSGNPHRIFFIKRGVLIKIVFVKGVFGTFVVVITQFVLQVQLPHHVPTIPAFNGRSST